MPLIPLMDLYRGIAWGRFSVGISVRIDDDVISWHLVLVEVHRDRRVSFGCMSKSTLDNISDETTYCKTNGPRLEGHQHNHLEKWVGLSGVFKDFPRHIPSGLWTTQTLTLLQRLACGPTQEPPEAFYRRENIDFLRRTVILLEGNPAAIELVVPEFKKVNYDGEAIFHKLMYGVCETPVNHMDVMPKCRFVRSMCAAVVSHSFIDFQATLIRAYLFGPFWTLMPTDLTNYFHFIYHGCDELVEQMREHWPEVETKLFKAGILTYATITRRNGQEIPCYHVHPLFTIMARSCFGETQWMLVRAAFIRQALL